MKSLIDDHSLILSGIFYNKEKSIQVDCYANTDMVKSASVTCNCTKLW